MSQNMYQIKRRHVPEDTTFRIRSPLNSTIHALNKGNAGCKEPWGNGTSSEAEKVAIPS
jgi:hypothetical protein